MGSDTSWLCRIWGGWDGPSKTTSSAMKLRFGIWARAVETADVVCGKCSHGQMQKADGECSLPSSDGARPPGSYPGPEPEPPGLRSGQAGEPLPSAPQGPPSLDHLPPPAQGFRPAWCLDTERGCRFPPNFILQTRGGFRMVVGQAKLPGRLWT